MPKEYLEIPFEVKADDINEDGTFSGWGSLFDQNPDAHRDVVQRGSFQETLAKGGRNQTGIMMGWQHNMRGMPPGVWIEIREDQKGLYVKGQLALDTELGKDAHSIMKLGAKTGTWRFSLSIGYDAIEEEYKKIRVGAENIEINIRVLKKIELWEISIVNFPAKLGATILNVKGLEESIKEATTERDLEKALRDSCGYSRSEAQTVISIVKAGLRDSKAAGEAKVEISGLEQIQASLTEANKDLNTFWGLDSIRKSLCELNELNELNKLEED